MSYSNGDTYDGTWSNDMRDGQGIIIAMLGILYYNDGGYYNGEWKNDAKNGNGKFACKIRNPSKCKWR